MGNFPLHFALSSQQWAVYKRWKDTDKYADQPVHMWENASQDLALNRFKHEVHAYALGKYEYEGVKAVYLYNGRSRIAKAWLDELRAGILDSALAVGV